LGAEQGQKEAPTKMTDSHEYICREGGEADFEDLVEFLIRHDYAPKHLNWSRQDYMGWLKWKCVRNPDGPGRLFLVEDSKNDIVGFRISLPRKYTSANAGTFTAYQGVDVLVDSRLRKKGLYTKLRQFANPRLGGYRLSFPNRPIIRISKRFGDRIFDRCYKWSFPLAMKESVDRNRVSLIASIVDILLKVYVFSWLGRIRSDLHMKHVNRFEKDIDIDPQLLHGIRSADYLNWRFADNPMYDYFSYEFIENGECIGYCVYARVRASVEIYDFVVPRRQRECLRLLADQCRSNGSARLRFRGIGLRLAKYGFIRRRDFTNNCNASSDVPEGDWLLTMADRDY
jgi:hypothetical protein